MLSPNPDYVYQVGLQFGPGVFHELTRFPFEEELAILKRAKQAKQGPGAEEPKGAKRKAASQIQSEDLDFF